MSQNWPLGFYTFRSRPPTKLCGLNPQSSAIKPTYLNGMTTLIRCNNSQGLAILKFDSVEYFRLLPLDLNPHYHGLFFALNGLKLDV